LGRRTQTKSEACRKASHQRSQPGGCLSAPP
jgi:hypothetical protein